MNEGKKFEEDIKKSVPEGCWVYRFKDSAGSWQGGENARFTPSNICDFMVMAKDVLFLMELKSHKGASIPFSCIRKNQIEDMSKIIHPNIKPIFLFNFRDTERTYAVSATDVKRFMESLERKSIPIKWCVEHGKEISAEKKRVRFKYYLENLFNGSEEKCLK